MTTVITASFQAAAITMQGVEALSSAMVVVNFDVDFVSLSCIFE